MTTAVMGRRGVTDQERQALEDVAGSAAASGALVARARAVLAVLDGVGPPAVARQLGLPRTTVYSWVRRFIYSGVAGLHDRPRRMPAATSLPRE
jgi:hypothetical protein